MWSSKTTNGVRVSVKATYREEHSFPEKDRYVFSYKVRIENLHKEPVQLLSRKWFIIDSGGFMREVEGEGVIGLQPVLAPDQTHEYESWSPLRTPLGKMYGYYHMEDKSNGKRFEVEIPEFRMVADFKMN